MSAAWLLAAALTLPIRALTPGATRPVTVKELCTPGSAAQARKELKASDKVKAYARYHIRVHRVGDYEVDHLISLELGGSNDITNLWPQRYHGRLNAHDKDRLENQLHALVCAGALSLEDAQHAIRTDWTAALIRYGGKSGPR